MTGHLISTLAAHLSTAHTTLGMPCVRKPPGMGDWADKVTGWVEWGVLGLIGVAAFVSIGTILCGRIFSHPHASRMGAIGLAVTLLCGILFVTVYAVVHGITSGHGC